MNAECSSQHTKHETSQRMHTRKEKRLFIIQKTKVTVTAKSDLSTKNMGVNKLFSYQARNSALEHYRILRFRVSRRQEFSDFRRPLYRNYVVMYNAHPTLL